MLLIKRFILVTAALFLVAAAFAQMSDQQLIEELKRYSTSGLSQEKILTELASKGVTREQLERIKAQYDSSKATATGTAVTPDNRTRENVTSGPDQVVVVNAPAQGPNEIFGRNLFSSKNLTFQPNLNLPTPENYQLGTGDEIIVDIWGNSEYNYRQRISPDGNIIVPNIGPIHLNGLDIKEASTKIRRAFSRIYSDLASGSPGTYIKTSLGNIRSIQVNIMGEVTLPGTYTLSSFATVFHALYSAGGINDIGSLRDIKVYRSGKLIAQTDVYEYLLKGDNSGDIVLKEGDLVRVEPYKKRVHMTGAVKRPMWYEMKEGEPLEQLVKYAGGFTSNAFKKNVRLTRKGDTELKVYTVEYEIFDSFMLKDGDEITADSILIRYENRVSIGGSVFRPGDFALDSSILTLKDLVAKAEGPTEEALLTRVLLYRENADLTTRVESIDLDKLLKGTKPDIALKKNDRLYVPNKNELKDELFITLAGEVKRPSNYPFVYSMSIEDLILQGGGLLESASRARVDVSRRIKDPLSTQESTVQSEVFSFNLHRGYIVNGDKNFVLRPYDIVVVRRSPGYEVQKNVSIAGEVLFGGTYSLVEKEERISSIIKRAGGLTSSAYVKGARITRTMTSDEYKQLHATLKLTRDRGRGSDSISVESLNIAGMYQIGFDLNKALDNPGGEDDLVLAAGDEITIPGMNNVVKISGAVMYPNAVAYSKVMTMSDYIKNAGGYGFRARRNRAYVVYMSGKVSKGPGSRIEPGCEIIVPYRPEREKITTSEILGVSTSIASIAALIMAIIR
jgi:protein involved in polysaccharide export with SLBB domain